MERLLKEKLDSDTRNLQLDVKKWNTLTSQAIVFTVNYSSSFCPCFQCQSKRLETNIKLRVGLKQDCVEDVIPPVDANVARYSFSDTAISE